ncbi:MAG: peptide ABC transporter substrate-binding protein [Lachnotalea sp.]
MKKSKVITLAMATLLSVYSLTGCGNYEKDTTTSQTTTSVAESGDVTSSTDSTVSTATGSKIIRYSVADEPPTLDPQLVNSMYGATLDFHLFEGLMRNNDGTVEPACAETYELSDDGLVYTFHLRQGLVWSDGVVLTANDFVYGIQRLVNPATASPSSFMGMIVKNAAAVNSGELPIEELGVKALDDSTIEITLENPAGYFLGVLSTAGYYPCRKDLVEKYGKDFAADADKNVYNGPFTLTDWQHASLLTFKKNDNYWNKDIVNLDGLDISIVTDKSTALGMYETGDLDFAEVPGDMTANYPDSSSYYSGAVEYLQINVAANDILANKNFRNAMSAAINREEFVALATSGNNTPTTRYVLPQVSGVTKTYGEEYPLEAFETTNDNDKAQEYLNAALKELNIASASDIKIVLNVADADSSRKQAEVVQEQLQSNLGIVIEINQVPYKQLYELHAAHDYEMMFTGWVPDYSDPFSYLEFFETDNGYNNSVYSNPEYDKFIQKAKGTVDVKERLDALYDAEKILCEDLPIIPLDLVSTHYLINDKITNFKPYFVGTGLNYITADVKE